MSAEDHENGAIPNDPLRAARGLPKQPQIKRFYVAASAETSSDGMHRVLLDGRPARTPRKTELALPERALADAVAAEWQAQATHIDVATMPLTRLVNTALDGVTGREDDVRADIVKYAGSDLLCYRAEGPEALVRRQAEAWDPILAWVGAELGEDFVVQSGIMPVGQSPATSRALDRLLRPFDAFALTALHVMTTLTGSAILAFAVQRRRLDLGEAWAAAHIDEDWQIAVWGEDDEAAERRARRFVEMQAACRLLDMLSARGSIA